MKSFCKLSVVHLECEFTSSGSLQGPNLPFDFPTLLAFDLLKIKRTLQIEPKLCCCTKKSRKT